MEFGSVALVVSDARKSTQWHREKLEFEMKSQEGDWITVSRKGMPLEVHLCEKHYPLETVNPIVEKVFAKHGIKPTVFFNVESINPAKRTVSSIEGETFEYDLLLMIPPHRGAKVVEESGLGDRGGWLPTDRFTLRTKAHEDIFALGDCTDIPVSKSGAAAHYEAKVVASSIVADVRGEQTTAKYDGRVRCYCDAGYHKGFSMTFDYEHPPIPPPMSLKGWIGKQVINMAYWRLIPQGRV